LILLQSSLARSMLLSNKAFFSEEKNQKTFRLRTY
jgi:hypothetical protein